MPVLTEDALYFGVLKQGFVVLFFKLLLAAFRVARDTAAKSARLARGGVRGARLSLFGDSSLGISTSPLASCPSECTSWQLSLTTPVPQHSIADLQLVTSAVRWPRDDEVVVRVHAIGLNFTDVFTILGLYAETRAAMATAQDGFGLCPGLEFAGEVVRIGRNVSGLRPGDRVCGFTVGGAFRTVVTCREALLRPIPANWTYEHAAALLVHGVTAWHALVELGRATKKSRVLVHAAAGGVGSMAMRLCQSMGCQV